jgi:PPK2 family polyphosphate:nucleotide phosphotransferase
MKLSKELLEELCVSPGDPAGLAERGTAETRTRWLADEAGSKSRKKLAGEELKSFRTEFESTQELLFATKTYALLVVFQGLDAAGKDGTVKHVMSGVNPQGCDVFSFKEPTALELDHDFFWRCVRVLPERGHIGIFNRSYYEEVLVVRVHPDLLDAEHLPGNRNSLDALWKERYEDINAFEHHLHRAGTRIVKFFLHVSKSEQRRRLLARLDDPAKYWKFSASDLSERAYFDEYLRAYEEAISATSTHWAPWYVIPADDKSEMRALVGGILTHAIDELDLHLPEPTPAALKAMDEARRSLLAE